MSTSIELGCVFFFSLKILFLRNLAGVIKLAPWRARVSDAASPIIGISAAEVGGQDKVLWKFGGVRWVSRQNSESHDVFHEKIVKKYYENNFRFAKSNSYISVVP